jgi:hypothetical protein
MEVKESEQKRNLKMFLSLLFAAILFASIVPIACADPGWNYRRAINITNSGSALTDYQVLVTLNDSNFDYSKTNADGSDLRFTNYANSTAYHYWIETWNTAGESRIWVNVSSVPATESKMYMWYNNSEASCESDGEATFLVFDDFLGDSLSSNWDTSGVTSVGVSGSVAIMRANTGAQRSLVWTPQTSDDVCIEARQKSVGLNPAIGTVARKQSNSGNTWNNQYFTYSSNVKYSSKQLIGKVVSGSYSEITGNDDYNLGSNTWYRTKFYLYGSDIKNEWYNDSGNLIQTMSGTDSTYSSGYIGLVVWWDDKTEYFDWIRVRKYSDPEPTTEISATEEYVGGDGVDPVPELPTIVLFSVGLLVLAGYVVLRRKNR